MKLVLATTSAGKIKEMAAYLQGYTLLSLKDYPELGEIVEDGETFAENALIKARAVCAHTGLPALADDSGLVVDFLGGEPGVRSARWVAGSDSDRNEALLRRLEGVADRSARFVSVIAVVTPHGRSETFEGVVEGAIGLAPRGEGGFGYDPLFVLPDGRTYAELSVAEKNQLSHRGRALALVAAELSSLLATGQK